jgi:hypothetical protein
MKHSLKLGLVTSLISASVLSGCSSNVMPTPENQESASTHACCAQHPKTVSMTPEEMAKAWEKAAIPTEQHRLLKDQVGSWNVVVKFWHDPSGQPDISKGVSRIMLEHNGKFLREDFKGNWMGHPFTGGGYTGYDTIQNKFFSTWIDSASPLLNTMHGKFVPESNTWIFNGEATCPVSGTTHKSEMISHKVDKNHFLVESYIINPDGSKAKTMELSYTRAKG